jgi:hypothetical protein
MTDMSNTTGRTDAVRDGRHLMQQDEANTPAGLILQKKEPYALRISTLSELYAPEHPNYRYGPTVTT